MTDADELVAAYEQPVDGTAGNCRSCGQPAAWLITFDRAKYPPLLYCEIDYLVFTTTVHPVDELEPD
jgi:hypothetical protein